MKIYVDDATMAYLRSHGGLYGHLLTLSELTLGSKLFNVDGFYYESHSPDLRRHVFNVTGTVQIGDGPYWRRFD